jgi:hypothetical protein
MRKHILISCLAITVVSIGAVTPAQAASPQPQRTCVIVVGKAPMGNHSPVRSKTCSTDPDARSLKAAAARTVLLMEWLENANNRPPSLTRIHGDDGDCDSAGYRMRVRKTGHPTFWDNRISGFNSYSWCNVVTGYDLITFKGDRETWNGTSNLCGCVLVGWVGHRMNDRISSFWIRRG